MLRTSNLARRIYAVFLRLYPSGFREAFADEMRAVFAEAAAEAGRRGYLALGGMVVRELRGLLTGALNEFWHALFQKEAAMSNTFEMNGATSTAQINLPGGSEPGSWKRALLAGLPHLLMGCFFVTLTLIDPNPLLSSSENLSDVVPIAFAVILMILVGVVLFFARRRGWPRWAASWYLYAGILVAIPLLILFQLIDESSMQGFLGILMFVVPVLLAVLLYEVARRDRIKEVLIALPVMTLLWGALQEFVPPEVDVFLYLWGWALTAVVAVIIVRLDNWRLGVWLFLGLSLLVGLSTAYAYVYLNNMPFQYAPDRTSFEVLKYLAPQFLTFSTLVLGPLLVWRLWEVGRRSGPLGLPGYRLMYWGLLVLMVCFTGAFYLSSSSELFEYRDTGISLLVTGAALGSLTSLFGALVLGTAAVINKTLTNISTTVLVVGIPLGLPWVFSLFLNNFGMATWLLLPFKDFPFSVAYLVGLGWVLLAAWMVTHRHWDKI